MSRLISIKQQEEWTNVLKYIGLYDTYHLPEYHQLAKDTDEGEPYLFVFEKLGYCTAFPFLLRNINNCMCLEDTRYYDTTSVYGYPGLLTNIVSSQSNAANYKADFQTEFIRLLRDLKVVSFFSRLNPLISNDWLLEGLGVVMSHGETVSIDLTKTEVEQLHNMSKGHRYDINKARKNGVYVVEDRSFKHTDTFVEIYNETMKRNSAADYYFFPLSYYYKLKDLLGDSLKLYLALVNDTIISASLFMMTGNVIQYHLSGSRTEYLSLSGAKVILDEVRRWGASNGYSKLHLGGGVGGSKNQLFRFKAGFSKDRYTFKTYRLVVDNKSYDELVRQKGLTKDGQNTFFPAYRIEG